jgi:hypothetical protein
MTGAVTSPGRIAELQAIVNSPALIADAMGGDAEARDLLNAARVELREAERTDAEGAA